MLRASFLTAALLSGLASAAIPSALGAEPAALELDIEYNRDVRPLLVDNCFACHGADSASRQAELRLDKRDAAIEMGAITPGDLAASGLVERIESEDPDLVMPPPATKKKLTAEQKALLKKWIASGAEYQQHWSFIPPSRPPVPDVATVDGKSWVKNPIDNFVLEKLHALGLQPAPEADRRTLARRVSLDLTGLPPEPALVESFVADQSSDAYEKLVDKLLASPHWGEHRGRGWLDVARYGDTHGIHNDNFREMWTYRDWVINAFNANMPFDQFTVEQLAGDLLPNRTLDQQIASGFNRCNITTSEGGAINEEYLVLYTRDRVETVSQTWLGMTAGCAVCHDHKFDPLSQKEFYEMAAFFNNTTQAAMDGNISNTPPNLPVPKLDDMGRWQSIDADIAAAGQRVSARKDQARGEFDTWLGTAEVDAFAKSIPSDALHLAASLSDGQGEQTKVQVDGAERELAISDKSTWQPGSAGGFALQTTGAAFELPDVGDFERDQPFSCSAWIKLNPNDSDGAIAARMDNDAGYRGWDFWVAARRVGTHIVNKWSEDAVKVVATAQVKGNEWTYVTVTYDGSSKASGVKIYYDGKVQRTKTEVDSLKSTIKTEAPFKVGQRNTSDPLAGVTVQDLRLYKKALNAGEVETLGKISRFTAMLAKPADQRTTAEKDELYGWWLNAHDEPYREASAALGVLEKEKNDIKARGTVALVMQEKDEAAMAYILSRGEYDRRADPVKPAVPAILPAMQDDDPRNRLGYAKWLLRDDHPLTARVTVNRFWQELFGTGIVRTAGDFGITGELPVNQPLLDWLAVDFREHWDVKRFYKQMVMSNAYRQSAIATPEKLLKDLENRFVSRGPRYRMDAEMVRDYALAASGILVPKLGGPSVKPYQPEGVWEAVAMTSSNTRFYVQDTGDKLYRRSMYTFWKRSAPPASMEIFNAPSREMCAVSRERTNTPLQALVTLNDPQLIEAARFLSQRALQEGGSDDTTRLEFITKRLLSRQLKPAELQIVLDTLKTLREYYSAHVEDAQKLIAVGESKADSSLNAAELAAWTMTTNELMNMDEVLNK